MLLATTGRKGGLFSNEALLIFNFHFWSAFIAWPSERERSSFRFSIGNLCQGGNSQHAINANELCIAN